MSAFAALRSMGPLVRFISASVGKFRQIGFLLVAAALVAGCATRNGATLEALTHTVGPPRAGQARVFVLRDKDLTIIDTGWQVMLDGTAMDGLKTGTFVYRDRPAGPHKLSFERGGDFSRASTRQFTVAAGRTYYFRLELNEKGRMVLAAGSTAGLIGLFASSAISAAVDERGFFDFTPLDEATARQAMAELRLSD